MNQLARVNMQMSMNDEFKSNSKIFDLPVKYWDRQYSNFQDYTGDLKSKKEKCCGQQTNNTSVFCVIYHC